MMNNDDYFARADVEPPPDTIIDFKFIDIIIYISKSQALYTIFFFMKKFVCGLVQANHRRLSRINFLAKSSNILQCVIFEWKIHFGSELAI